MQEVLRRQNKTHFDNSNLWTIAINVAAIVVSFFTPALVYQMYVPSNYNSKTLRLM